MGNGPMGYEDSLAAEQQLWPLMAEDLRLPLVQISRLAELRRTTTDDTLLDNIELTAEQVLWFLDSYLLGQKLNQRVGELEPVAVSGVMNDTAHQLQTLATQHNCRLELRLPTRGQRPILTNRQALQTALVGVGQTLIAAQARPDTEGPRPVITLDAHRSVAGSIVAGVFADRTGLNETIYRQGKRLVGRARQPLGPAGNGADAGIFIADMLMAAISYQLRFTRRDKQTGLAATLQPIDQLRLV